MPSDDALAESERLYLWTLNPCCGGVGCAECAGPGGEDTTKEKTMKRFTVYFDARVVKTISVEVEADSYVEAVAKAKASGHGLRGGDLEKHLRFAPWSVCGPDSPCDSFDVLAFCEGCSAAILDEHPDSAGYASGEDGYACAACVRSATEDHAARFAKLPEIMQAALQGLSPALVVENVEWWEAADEATRADILAFFESDGPEKLRQAKVQHEDGAPTAADLEKGLES